METLGGMVVVRVVQVNPVADAAVIGQAFLVLDGGRRGRSRPGGRGERQRPERASQGTCAGEDGWRPERSPHVLLLVPARVHARRETRRIHCAPLTWNGYGRNLESQAIATYPVPSR